ncbi:MAG TPA: adenylate kinase [Planctomycetota bacterium]|nr:adenylate kinase [Planctomycetota bacterium]
MRLVFLGPPGAGKGTQAQRLCASAGVPQVSTGDLFRAHVAKETALGAEAKKFMSRGELVPDSVVCDMVATRLAEPDCAKGFVLDGFPRTVPQAESLDRTLAAARTPLERCVEFVVDKDELVRRLTRRQTCRKCAAVYNLDVAPPARSGVCDKCGGEVYVRDDDRPETVSRRLAEYDAKTAPLSAYYRAKGLLLRLDAAQPPDRVYAELLAGLRRT